MDVTKTSDFQTKVFNRVNPAINGSPCGVIFPPFIEMGLSLLHWARLSF